LYDPAFEIVSTRSEIDVRVASSGPKSVNAKVTPLSTTVADSQSEASESTILALSLPLARFKPIPVNVMVLAVSIKIVAGLKDAGPMIDTP
jgi:hypothetical protein